MLRKIINNKYTSQLAIRSYSNDKSNVKELLENSTKFENIKPATTEDQWATSPYPNSLHSNRSQSQKSLRPRMDPKETSIILFPGQGTQYVGMGKNLQKIPEAKDIYEFANEILKYDLLKLCLEGPKSKLDKTIYSQPAIMVTSLAALEQLKEERPNAIESCIATAGFSLGELTALVFAGAIPFDQGLKLVQIRAEAMQAASDQSKGGMATILYGPDSDLGLACNHAKEWCLNKGIEQPECRISNYMYPHCKVIAGHLEALKFIETNLKKYKLKRMKYLTVSGAFHTHLMLPAVEPFRKALKKIQLNDPVISVHSNIDGQRYSSVNQILTKLPKQIVKPVKWEQTLHILYERSQGENFPRTFECGPGTGLTTILKQVNSKAWDSAFNIEA